MKKTLFVFIAIFWVIKSYSQVHFQSGYLIDNSGRKVECLIKNNDWSFTPTSFKYKLSEDSEPETTTVDSVREFGIYNHATYISRPVRLDRSSNDLNNLSGIRAPEFVEQRIFLEVLVKGKANLYTYKEAELVRYFYSVNESEIEPLIFKTYRLPNNRIGENVTFRQQLWNSLKCPAFSQNDFEDLKYNTRELTRLFVAYSRCNEAEVVDLKKKEKTGKNRSFFHLNVRPGLRYSSLSVDNQLIFNSSLDYGSKPGFRLGLEAEFVLPFNNNKWAVAIEPTHQYFNAKYRVEGDPRRPEKDPVTRISYSSIELPLSLRHYFFLNDRSAVFVEASFCLDFAFNSRWESHRADGSGYYSPVPISTRKPVYGFGTGYKYRDKYTLGFRYQSGRDLFSKHLVWQSDYRQLSVVFGYTIFS